MKKDIVFTFDYELFFGESGSIDNCLIKPTDMLLDAFKECNATATFFVDSTHLLMLKKEGLTEDYNRISNQICRMAKEGHEVALHIHPHWVDAKYKAGMWYFPDYTHYKIGSCSRDELSVLFEQCVNLLTSIVRSVDANYRVQSFRAGGWCIDPFANIKELFEKYDIKVDSSVIPFRKCVGNSISSYDYSDIKSDVPYRFSTAVHENMANGSFVEFPISTYRISPIDQVVALIKRRSRVGQTENVRFGDGKSVFDIERNSSLDRYTKYFKYVKSYYSCDAANQRTLDRIKADHRDLLTIVSHPKCQTPLSIQVIKSILSDENNECVSISKYLSSKNDI